MVAAKPTQHTGSRSSSQAPGRAGPPTPGNVQPNMQQSPKRARANIPADMPDDLADLALTEPRMAAIRLTPPPAPSPHVPISGAALSAAVNFAAYVSVRSWMTTPRLSRLSIEQRMRLFLLMGRVYFPALELAAHDHPEYQAGRMSGPLWLP